MRTQSMSDVDTVLRVYHKHASTGDLGLRQHARFDDLLSAHQSENGSEAGDEPVAKKQKVNGN